jgi:hypothetical protein
MLDTERNTSSENVYDVQPPYGQCESLRCGKSLTVVCGSVRRLNWRNIAMTLTDLNRISSASQFSGSSFL